MRIRNTVGKTGVAILALASQLFAGGPFTLLIGNPEASPEARKMNAVLTVRSGGCSDPAKSEVTASAIGVVNGERRTIPLKMVALSEPGTFGIARQWPKEGRWVIQFVGHNGSQVATTLLTAGPQGIDRDSAKTETRQASAGEVEAMLRK